MTLLMDERQAQTPLDIVLGAFRCVSKQIRVTAQLRLGSNPWWRMFQLLGWRA
jgi:hypothetical protein